GFSRDWSSDVCSSDLHRISRQAVGYGATACQHCQKQEHAMTSEFEKMVAGKLYHPTDAELTLARRRARDLCQALNACPDAAEEERRRITTELFGRGGESVMLQRPIYSGHGSNLELGEGVFLISNCAVRDVWKVRTSSKSLFGHCAPSYPPMRPLTVQPRQR